MDSEPDTSIAIAGAKVRFGDRVTNPKGSAVLAIGPRTAVQGGHCVVGEQAGIQDALAGFGMRYAVRSGILAARSLIAGVDYTRLWRRELLPLLRAGISNRFIFNSVGHGYEAAAALSALASDPSRLSGRAMALSGAAYRSNLRPCLLQLRLVPARCVSRNNGFRTINHAKGGVKANGSH
tara:strand:- start:3630 stop:4169 length:540 start_codon:yes stop_codon:yes gene_type:complete